MSLFAVACFMLPVLSQAGIVRHVVKPVVSHSATAGKSVAKKVASTTKRVVY